MKVIYNEHMKICSRCKIKKELSCFRIRNAKTGSRQAFCIDCNKEYNKEHYLKNRDKYLQKAEDYREKNGGRKPTPKELLLYNYKKNNACIDCGEKDPIVLSFDHRDRKEKSFTISANKGKYSIEELRAEIAKCDIRCLNCHAKVTAKQFNWYLNYGPLE